MNRESPQPVHVLQHFVGAVVQRAALVLCVPQREAAIAADVGRDDLDVRFALAQVVLAREQLAHAR